ncbi:MAG: hypothetical protein M1274_15330 [Actinobacteria bacterium]|nr:hypothetical protein [Actinomycetota bacterium]
MSERETANSVALANRLAMDDHEGEDKFDEPENEELYGQLRQVSTDLANRWSGALFALSPRNPDAARHFCASAREIFATILDTAAPDSVVLHAVAAPELTDQGTPTRRAKLRYLLGRKNLGEPALEDFADADIEDVIQLSRLFNDGTHGSAGVFSFPQLNAIRRRVEDGIAYLVEIAA